MEQKLNITPLKSRRNFIDEYFFFKFLNNFTYNPELLQTFFYNVPQIATHNFRIFYTETRVKNIVLAVLYIEC